MSHIAVNECIRDCHDCKVMCIRTAKRIHESHETRFSDLKNLLMECAKVCDFTESALTFESKYHVMSCQMCVDICNECSIACEKENESECAEICRQCVASCSRMT